MSSRDKQPRVSEEEDRTGVEEVISAPDEAFARPATCGGATFGLSPIPANPFSGFAENVEVKNTPTSEHVRTVAVSRTDSNSTASTFNESATFDLGVPPKSSIPEYLPPSIPPPDYSTATGHRISPTPYRGTVRELDYEEVTIADSNENNTTTGGRKRGLVLLKGRRMPAFLRGVMIVLAGLLGGGLIILVMAFFAGAFNDPSDDESI